MRVALKTVEFFVTVVSDSLQLYALVSSDTNMQKVHDEYTISGSVSAGDIYVFSRKQTAKLFKKQTSSDYITSIGVPPYTGIYASLLFYPSIIPAVEISNHAVVVHTRVNNSTVTRALLTNGTSITTRQNAKTLVANISNSLFAMGHSTTNSRLFYTNTVNRSTAFRSYLPNTNYDFTMMFFDSGTASHFYLSYTNTMRKYDINATLLNTWSYSCAGSSFNKVDWWDVFAEKKIATNAGSYFVRAFRATSDMQIDCQQYTDYLAGGDSIVFQVKKYQKFSFVNYIA